MGDPSHLRFVPSSCVTTPIDWTKVPEASKEFLLAYYSSESDSEGSVKTRPLPATIRDLAKMLDGSTKFFGYMAPSVFTLLLDISEFGLAKPCPTESIGRPVGPRFYMRHLDAIWFVLFVPGYRDGISGHSPDIPYTDDLHEDAGNARDKALAEDYDAKLCEEVSRKGTSGVTFHGEVAGWGGSTLESDLEFSHMTKAITRNPDYIAACVGMAQRLRDLDSR